MKPQISFLSNFTLGSYNSNWEIFFTIVYSGVQVFPVNLKPVAVF